MNKEDNTEGTPSCEIQIGDAVETTRRKFIIGIYL